MKIGIIMFGILIRIEALNVHWHKFTHNRYFCVEWLDITTKYSNDFIKLLLEIEIFGKRIIYYRKEH